METNVLQGLGRSRRQSEKCSFGGDEAQMSVREYKTPVGGSDTHDRKVKPAKTSDEGELRSSKSTKLFTGVLRCFEQRIQSEWC